MPFWYDVLYEQPPWPMEVRILEAEAKALSLEAKAKDTKCCPRGSSRQRPGLEDYITDIRFHVLLRGLIRRVIQQRSWRPQHAAHSLGFLCGTSVILLVVVN